MRRLKLFKIGSGFRTANCSCQGGKRDAVLCDPCSDPTTGHQYVTAATELLSPLPPRPPPRETGG